MSAKKISADRLLLEKADAKWKAEQKAKGKSMDSYGRVMTKRACEDKPMADFWGSVDQKEMQQALVESGEERALELAHKMTHTKRNVSLSTMCRETGVPLQTLNELWKKHHLAVGMAKAAARLPKVMEDVAIDAESTFVLCPRCDGIGSITRPQRDKDDKGQDIIIEVEVQCPNCKGAREVRQVGDKDSRAFLFESMGITKKGGPLAAVQVNIGDDFEGVMAGAQKLIQVQGSRAEEED